MPNITANITLGLEIEAVRISEDATGIFQRRGFDRHFDRTILADNGGQLPRALEDGGGSELVTPPYTVGLTMTQDGNRLAIDYRDTMAAVEDLCAATAHVNTSCGLHLHLGRPHSSGGSRWDPERVRTMLCIGLMLEERLFKVVPSSRVSNRYCAKIRSLFQEDDLRSFYPTGTVAPRKYNNPKRYCWLNLIETRRVGTDPTPSRAAGPATGTVEVRLLGNVRRFAYIWAWTQLWTKIGAYVAYLPSSLAIMHCTAGGSLEPEFANLARHLSAAPLGDGPIVNELAGASIVDSDGGGESMSIRPRPVAVPSMPPRAAPAWPGSPSETAAPAAPAWPVPAETASGRMSAQRRARERTRAAAAAAARQLEQVRWRAELSGIPASAPAAVPDGIPAARAANENRRSRLRRLVEAPDGRMAVENEDGTFRPIELTDVDAET